MKIDLARMTKRPSKRPIVLRPIMTTAAQADTLSAVYLRIVKAWSEGQDRINSAYAKTLNELQTDSADDIQRAIDELADTIRRLVLTLTPDLRNWALGIERVQRGKWISNIMSAASVDLTTVLTPGDVEDTLQAQIEWNVSLIRDVSDETRRRIANSVFAGLQQRKPANEIAREISEAIGMARARARRIASDQTIKLGERLNRARQEQAGISKFKWRHSGKLHPRSWHLARNGKIYPWTNSGIPASDMPGVPPFCGCTAQGVVEFDE
ncbi:MAG: minor capsid protein [Methylocystis sp.]|uniref:minor capsid protein n=1 Tax=Methylocystis sp. TaxID=1911079 RepID=UPI003DA33412